jgi:hypothetical protein
LLTVRAMSSLADRLGEGLEALVDSRRARLVGAVLGGLVLLGSMGFWLASKGEPRKSAAALALHLPPAPLNVPIMRSLPQPQPRKAVGLERPADGPLAKARGRSVTARR